MKNIDIIEKLTNDITRNAYHAEIQDYIAHILDYDRNMMEFEASVNYGKAFEAVELLNLLTGTEKGDDLYNNAKKDAHGTIDNARVDAATETGTNPTNSKAYRTEDAARRAAAEMGLTVSAVGDLWQILHATH